MGAVFQLAQNACFDMARLLYGEDCTWGSITDTVLFNDPTKNQKFSVISGRTTTHTGADNADIVQPYMEYRKGQFCGLYELVYGDGDNQYVTICGKRYVCVKLTSFFDGQTIRIALNEAITDPILSGL